MNLTTPPPVEDLDPQYAEDLRAELVRSARHGGRQWSAWTPIIAAACGVAVITSGIVASTRTGSEPDPAGTPTPASSVAQKVPPGASERINLDRGSDMNEDFGLAARAVTRQCLAAKRSALGEPNNAKPGDVRDVYYTAHLQKALPGEDGVLEPVKNTYLLQNHTTATGIQVQCRNTELLQSFDPKIAGVSWERSRNLSAAVPVNGSWTYHEIPNGNSTLLHVGFSFSALPSVSKVELRIRWTGGASPWYAVPRHFEGTGYAAASQAGAVHERGKTEVDYRALDRSGKVIFSGVEYG